ncbi:MAG: nucleotidyltransferase family protein [Bacteroidales bacterium]|nr:nucleotidyltransferase family protein [Bacteroidales bacterium]
MDKIQKHTLSLLQSALFGLPPSTESLSEEEWQLVYVFAKEQGVTSLCYEAILLLPEDFRPPRKLMLQWAVFVENVEKNHLFQKMAIGKLSKMIADTDAKILIMKGFSLSRYYPVPMRREFGDVDIYCCGHHDEVCRIVEEAGIEVSYENYRHSVFRIDGVPFENHRYFLYARNEEDEKQLETFLQQKAETCRKQSDKNVLLGTHIGTAVFFLKHAEKDFVFSRINIRLRTLCDWAMMLKNGAVDYNQLNSIKKGKTIDRFADVLTVECVEKLGLSPDFLRFFPPVKRKVLDDFLFMTLNYQSLVKTRGTFKGRLHRLFKYLKHYKTYKYIFGKNIIKWYYFSK